MSDEGYTIGPKELYDAIKELDTKFDAYGLIQVNHEGRIGVIEKALQKKSDRGWQFWGILLAAMFAIIANVIPLLHL